MPVTCFLGIGIGVWLWAKKLPVWEGFDLSKWNPIQKMAGKQWGIDKVLTDDTIKMSGLLGNIAAGFDKYIIDGIVNATGSIVKLLGGGIRQTQTGYVRSYALLMQIGVVALIGYLLYAVAQGVAK